MMVDWREAFMKAETERGNLAAELAARIARARRPWEEREPPHCPTCGCGLTRMGRFKGWLRSRYVFWFVSKGPLRCRRIVAP